MAGAIGTYGVSSLFREYDDLGGEGHAQAWRLLSLTRQSDRSKKFELKQ